MNLADGIILFMVALSVLFGYRKNLIRNFFDFLAVIVSLYISSHFFGAFASFVVTVPGVSHLMKFISGTIISKLQSLDSETVFTLQGMKDLNLGQDFGAFFERGSFFTEKSELVFSELSLALVSNVAAIVLLFIASLFVIHLIGSFFENTNKMAGLMGIERLGGLVFSTLRGLSYGLVVALIVHNLAGFFNSGLVYDLYHQSSFATMFYDSGLLKALIW
ncbi:MAG: hypothetical protein GX046_06545 [Tissierellia bacterium]|jgi:membrane protein required for colicin V production|nr:hypothetical protein [Tissierellia bacterium]